MTASNQQYSTNTGLSSQPELAGLTPDVMAEFTRIYNAIRILQAGLDNSTGQSVIDSVYWSEIPASATIKLQDLTQLYVIASENIAAGELVNLYNSGSVLTARRADAATPRPAKAFCRRSVTSGDMGQFSLGGVDFNFAGLTPGFNYWLSNTAGTVTPSPPGGPLDQYVGFALSATELWFTPTLP